MNQILDDRQLNETIDRMADLLVDICPDNVPWAIVGIRTRGVALAERLKDRLEKRTDREIPLGWLDITLYRDDLHELDTYPIVRQTKLGFEVTDKCVILVDDVLFTGRTIRAALNAMADFGRPRYVKLAVLVDRGHRELPIQADVVGLTLHTEKNEIVDVQMTETDAADGVLIRQQSRA